MAAVTFSIEPDELQGLSALAELDKAAGGGGADPGADAVSTARTLMDTALAARLSQAGLPWAPPEDAVRQRAVEVARQAIAPRRGPGLAVLRKDTWYALAAAALVALWGGYARGWKWTGFQANGQLWDWLNLLLLPVVVGVIPLWMQYRAYIARPRRLVYAAVLVAWTVFVTAGYLIPIGWTGFRGETLWSWLNLVLLPAALAVTMALTSMRVGPVQFLRSMRPGSKVIMAALAAGWAVTVIGGYALRWKWTGYTDNTLWQWLQLLLLPLLVPTVLLPVLLKLIAGDAAVSASQAPAVPSPGAAPRNVPVGA